MINQITRLSTYFKNCVIWLVNSFSSSWIFKFGYSELTWKIGESSYPVLLKTLGLDLWELFIWISGRNFPKFYEFYRYSIDAHHTKKALFAYSFQCPSSTLKFIGQKHIHHVLKRPDNYSNILTVTQTSWRPTKHFWTQVTFS